MDFKNIGYDEKVVDREDGLVVGRVIAVHRELYKVICVKGEVEAVLKASIYYYGEIEEAFPAVGDYILLDYNPSGSSRIVKTIERKSYFSRKDPDIGKGEASGSSQF